MSAWGKSDNKSSDGTVTLTAPSITFNGATGHAAGVYTSAGHPFQLGDPVVYSNGGGTSVVGLTSGNTYYVTNVTANTFMVAATEADALHNFPTTIASTDGIGTSHTFTLPLAFGRGTLTGTNSTIFTEELFVGDIVRASATGGNQEMIVIAVTSDTLATVINANPGTTLTAFADDESYRIHEKPTFVSSVATTDFESTQVFGVRSDEIHGDQTGGYISAVALIQGGAGYVEVPGVSFSGGGGADAEATATIADGVVTAIAVTNNGSSYETAPTVTVAGPVLTLPTSTVSPTFDYIQYTAHGQAQGAALKYQDGGGTAASGLTDNTTYYVSTIGLSANALRLASSSVLSAGTTLGTVAISGTGGQFTCANATLATGDRVQITGTLGGTGSITGYTTGTVYKVSAVTGTSPSVTGFTLTDEEGGAIVTTAGTPTGLTYKAGTLVNISGTGNNAQYLEIVAGTTATANAALGVNQGIDEAESGAVAHTGWVHRKVLTGAHAGRIQYEVLVALSKNGITSDASDDIAFPED
jgi:hypothetical protein